MITNNSLTARYLPVQQAGFSFFYHYSLRLRYSFERHADGYEKKKACPEHSRRELCPDYQASYLPAGRKVLDNLPNS